MLWRVPHHLQRNLSSPPNYDFHYAYDRWLGFIADKKKVFKIDAQNTSLLRAVKGLNSSASIIDLAL